MYNRLFERYQAESTAVYEGPGDYFDDVVDENDEHEVFEDYGNYYAFYDSDDDLTEEANAEPGQQQFFENTFSSNSFYPFRNELERQLLMFFKASPDRYSIRQIEKMMALMRHLSHCHTPKETTGRALESTTRFKISQRSSHL